MKKTQKYSCRAALLSIMLAAAMQAVAGNSAPAAATRQQAVFATVGDAVITQDEYSAAFNSAMRTKFYHGRPPEGGVAALQREVSDQLIVRALLLREAKDRGIKPDQDAIQKTLQSYEQRYANSEQWKKTREQVLPALTARLEQDSLLAQLEKTVRAVPKPTEKDVQAYYASHQEKFTEPEQLHVAVILLKVDPSSPSEAWVKASEEAQEIVKKLKDGVDFAELARLHSGDGSAQKGGDMGYLHQGMLAEGAEKALSALKTGEISNPVQMLEGMAVFRLIDRKVAKLNGFDSVASRAEGLLQREQSEQAWSKLIAGLRTKTPAKVDESQFLPLAEKATDIPAKK